MKLIITFSVVSLCLVMSLAVLLLDQQQGFLKDASVRRGLALANGLSSSSSSWVLANDLAGLQEALQGYKDTQNLVRGFILSTEGEILASTREEDVGFFVTDTLSIKALYSKPEPLILIASSNLIDVSTPIFANDRHIGWVRIELNQNAMHAHLRDLVITSLKFCLIVAVVIIFVASSLSSNMVRRLLKLERIAAKFEQGIHHERIVLSDRDDEITRLGRTLNGMLDAIVASEHQLDKLNQVYAAWAESAAIIVREEDEKTLFKQICQIMSEKVGMTLALIGKFDQDGWLEIIACSDEDSEYVRNLRVSSNPSLPEGHGPVAVSLREKTSSVFNDFLGDPRTAPWQVQAMKANIKSAACFPVFRKGEVYAGLVVYSTEIGFFNKEVSTLLNGLSKEISFAIDNYERERIRILNEVELSLAATVFKHSQEGIVITDADKRILRVNHVFTEITGFQPEEVIGNTPAILNSGSQGREFYQEMWAHIHEHNYWQGEIVNRHKDGRNYSEWLNISRVMDSNGNVTHYVGTFSDISDRKINEERIFRLAFYDPLTELPNRRLLIDRIQELLAHQQRKPAFAALLFLDLDRFKIINDSYGHDYGDQFLIEVGRRIKTCIREQDVLARLGGDEFVILLDDLPENKANAAASAELVSRKLLDVLSDGYVFNYKDRSGQVTTTHHHSSASIGVTIFHGREYSLEDLLKQADMAMYQAKQAGKNTMRMFDPEMQRQLNKRTEMENEMRIGINEGQFEMYYQIQVDDKGRSVGAETLIRWIHPAKGVIRPDDFIPLAEETGLIVEIGEWVFREACKTVRRWANDESTRGMTVSVNVSAKQLAESLFVSRVSQILEEEQADPSRIKIEITESAVLSNLSETVSVMKRLQELGISFSMDDFGTGYSSLSYLQSLPIRQLKIDKSFVRDFAADSYDAAIINTILTLGRSLGLDVVAEGVETEDQYRYLMDHGCRYFQGYLFGKPVSLPEFEAKAIK